MTCAPLTITAGDSTVRYGATASYSWTGAGWVGKDSRDTLDSLPACTATVQGVAASATTAPRRLPRRHHLRRAADPNYAISYVAGKLTVNPVIRLSQSGLPATVPHDASIDGQTVHLPTADVEVAYGSSHGYAFPGAVIDPNGVVYLSNTPAVTGRVEANLVVNAAYTTMSAFLTAAKANGSVEKKQADDLIKK